MSLLASTSDASPLAAAAASKARIAFRSLVVVSVAAGAGVSVIPAEAFPSWGFCVSSLFVSADVFHGGMLASSGSNLLLNHVCNDRHVCPRAA